MKRWSDEHAITFAKFVNFKEYEFHCDFLKLIDLARNMASLIESEAQFLQRMKDLRVSQNMQRKIVNAGFSTFGVLAYAHGQPERSIVDSQFESWVSNNLDSGASLADISCVKRLLFESQTLVLASLKEQVTGLSFESTVKKLPSAERETRLNVVKKQLTGLLIEGALEPAHCLLDLCASIHQHNEIKYIYTP